MSIDLFSAASDGCFALLALAITAGDIEVTTNPEQIEPTDTDERQYVLIGDIDSENEAGKGEQLERLTVQIIVIYRGQQRWKLHQLMHLVRQALDDATPEIAGVAFSSITWKGATSSPAGTDGITHAGAIEFELFAEPA